MSRRELASYEVTDLVGEGWERPEALAGYRLAANHAGAFKYLLAIDPRTNQLGILSDDESKFLQRSVREIRQFWERGSWRIFDSRPTPAPINLTLLKEITS